MARQASAGVDVRRTGPLGGVDARSLTRHGSRSWGGVCGAGDALSNGVELT